MPTQNLVATIEELQATIADQAKRLRRSEAQTCRTLIDPLLEALGWNVRSPGSVRVEFPTPGGTADYALLGDDEHPLVIVEAKRLDSQLEEAAGQALGYCAHMAYKHFAATDGNRWELYDYERPGPLHEKQVLCVEIRSQDGSAADVATSLWQSPLLAPRLMPATTRQEVEPQRPNGMSAASVQKPNERGRAQQARSEEKHGGRSIEAISQTAERRLRRRIGR